MTSRRSRLKAVANLPVRRKTQVLAETSNDPAPSDYIPSDKAACNTDNKASIVETCQSNETETFNYQSGSKEETLLCVNNDSNLENGFTENLISNLEPVENNNIESSRVTSAIKSFPTFKSRKHFKPNLVSSSLPKKIKKSEEVVSEVEKQSSDSVSINLINNNTVEEGSKSYTVLDSQTSVDNTEPTYTITTLTPCDSNSVDDVYDHQVTQEFEEVQLYTELEDPIDLFVNLPKVLNNEISESGDNIIEPEQEEPVFTTLITRTSNRETEKLDINYERTNLLNSVDNSNSVFAKPASKSVPVNGRTYVGGSEDALAISRHDKSILGNSNTSVSQNTTSESDSFNFSLRRSVASRRKRSRCNDFTKKLADARREFQKKYEKSKPDRSSLKMIDLIFYNPATNPMESKVKTDKRESISGQENIQELLAEEGVDEPEAMDCSSDLTSENGETENTNKMPVPQVKIGQNGEIILDEKSLVIETTEAKKGREDLQNSIPIFEDRGSKVSYYRGKTKKTRDWTDFETKRFYKALNTIGPDFSLMQKYFPKRSRLQLKNKFKREERLNRHLIDKALNNPSEFDMTLLEKDLAVEKKAEEYEIEMKLCRGIKEKQALKRPRVKSSLLSREMVESDGESENSHSQSAAIISKRMQQNEKSKKKKEINFVFQKIFLNKGNQQINELSEIGASPDTFRPTEHGVT